MFVNVNLVGRVICVMTVTPVVSVLTATHALTVALTVLAVMASWEAVSACVILAGVDPLARSVPMDTLVRIARASV